MRRILLIASILLVIMAVILFCLPDRPDPLTEPESARGRKLKEEPQPEAADVPTDSTPSTPGLLLPLVTMRAAEYRSDPYALNREWEYLPFEFRGGTGTGRIIDRQGNVLLESGEEIGIFGAVVGPDGKKVLVKGGDATNIVLEPSTGRKIILPSLPPGANMLGLGDWHWIGPNDLFGSSGIQAFNKKAEPVDCCEGHNVARTKFYTFDLLTERLSDVVMPDVVTQPVVNAVEVMSDGYIHLLQEEPHDGVEQDLGWFKIDASK